MLVAIVIIVILLGAAASVVLLAGRARAASTGSLSRETRKRDDSNESTPAPVEGATTSTEIEATGRERSDQTRTSAFGGLIRRRSGDVVEYEPVDEEEPFESAERGKALSEDWGKQRMPAAKKTKKGAKGVGNAVIGSFNDRSAVPDKIRSVMRANSLALAVLMLPTVTRTAEELVLRDAKNQPVRVSAVEIEQESVQPASLMPEGLLRDLTAQQAADLLDYLASLRGR